MAPFRSAPRGMGWNAGWKEHGGIDVAFRMLEDQSPCSYPRHFIIPFLIERVAILSLLLVHDGARLREPGCYRARDNLCLVQVCIVHPVHPVHLAPLPWINKAKAVAPRRR